MEDYISKIVQDAAKNLQIEKERLIKLRIKERVNEDVDLILEAQKRFSKILFSKVFSWFFYSFLFLFFYSFLFLVFFRQQMLLQLL